MVPGHSYENRLIIPHLQRLDKRLLGNLHRAELAHASHSGPGLRRVGSAVMDIAA